MCVRLITDKNKNKTIQNSLKYAVNSIFLFFLVTLKVFFVKFRRFKENFVFIKIFFIRDLILILKKYANFLKFLNLF